MLAGWRVPVTRIREDSQARNPWGERIPATPRRETLPPALFAPTPSSPDTGPGVEAVATDPTVYWPGVWPDVRVGDRLLIEGQTWHVRERPASWPLGLSVQLHGDHTTQEET